MSSIASPSFHRDLIHSYASLQIFFEGTKQVKEIHTLAELEKPIGYGESLLQNRWKVTLLSLSAKIKHILSLFIQYITPLLEKLGAKTWAIDARILSYHLDKDQLRLVYLKKFGKLWLVPSFNAHKLSSTHLYRSDSIEVHSIKDLKARKLFSDFGSILRFQHYNGVCRGMSNWFAYLYFQSQHKFDDPEKHLIAVAEQFNDGASEQAALLQNIIDIDQCINVQGDISPTLDKILNEVKTLSGLLKKIPAGFYGVGVYRHRFNLIKTNEHTFYIYDPNIGLLKFDIGKTCKFIIDSIEDDPEKELRLISMKPASLSTGKKAWANFTASPL